MPCTSPLTAYQTEGGEITFKARHTSHKQLQLPCGQCMDCRLERTRQWAVRIMHETQLHDESHFVTLTYSEDKVPRQLEHDHFQRFMKRLRFKHGKIRYYMCGEYGDLTGRPHYHAILFGLHLDDLQLHSEARGNRLYTSKTLSAVWTDGHATTGAVTMQSAQYCASYCTKKVTGEKALEHYTRFDAHTGEIYTITPEYARMSLKPGIASEWIKQYTDDVYNYDHVIINGRPQKPPRAYDKHLEMTNPARLEKLKLKRNDKHKGKEEKDKRQEHKARDANTKARMNLKRKTL